MNTLEITKNILRENKIIAKKSFGQNFLVDDIILEKIVESADLKEGDRVIEIGPGLGNLTNFLLDKKVNVTAFEIDTDMIDVLNSRFGSNDLLDIVNADILKINLEEYLKEKDKKNKVIANIPYYITTPIIFKLLEYRKSIEGITLMIQKEVAKRITASPHSKDYGALTINTNVFSDTKILFDVPKEAFVPMPNVTSTVIKIIPNEEKEKVFKLKNEIFFKQFVKKAFSERRKKLINSLYNTSKDILSKQQVIDTIGYVGLNENIRAEEVEIKDYVKMANYLYEKTQRK